MDLKSKLSAIGAIMAKLSCGFFKFMVFILTSDEELLHHRIVVKQTVRLTCQPGRLLFADTIAEKFVALYVSKFPSNDEKLTSMSKNRGAD